MERHRLAKLMRCAALVGA